VVALVGEDLRVEDQFTMVCRVEKRKDLNDQKELGQTRTNRSKNQMTIAQQDERHFLSN